MSPVKAFSRIVTDETLMESAAHGSRAFPFQYYYENIWDFDFHCVDWHWHSELELVLVQSGRAVCLIGEDRLTAPQGCALLINSRVIHRFEAEGDTVIPNAVFSPSLLAPEDSLIYRKYIAPYLAEGPDALLFDPAVPWQAACLRTIRGLFALQERSDLTELKTAGALLTLWQMMLPHVTLRQKADDCLSSDTAQARLQIMMQFIQAHYRENLRLADIAAAVHIGKSTALQIFQQGIHQSPVAYLIRYRLGQAAALLRATEKKIAAVSEETGFPSAGYFCRRFKALYGVTPQEYRSKREKSVPDVGIPRDKAPSGSPVA